MDGDRGEDFGAAAPKFRLSTAPKPEQVGQPASLQATQRQGRGARESAAAVPRRHDARRLARLTAASGGGVVVFQVTMLRGRRAATRSRSFVRAFSRVSGGASTSSRRAAARSAGAGGWPQGRH